MRSKQAADRTKNKAHRIVIKASTKKKNYRQLMNQINVHISLEHHDNIIRFHGFYFSSKLFAILLETANDDLLHFVKTNEFDNNETFIKFFVKIGIEIINGMIYLIENEILHRNLKASNVLLDEHGTAKISGFGLSLFFVNNSCTNYSDQNDKLLSIRWMAIESIDDRRYSEKSDVWSFGVLLYEILSRGRKPYEDVVEKDDQIIVYLKGGGRLSKPEIHADDIVFETIAQCWSSFPYYRPTFYELHSFFCQYL